MTVNSSFDSCYSSHTLQSYASQIITPTFRWAGGHTHTGDLASSLRHQMKILWFAPKTNWLSWVKMTLSNWPFTFHLTLPLHHAVQSLFAINFSLTSLSLSSSKHVWYFCRYKHRWRWDTCLGLCWLYLLV